MSEERESLLPRPWRRIVHKRFAEVMGYFWLPCPLCGEEFGGHEWGNSEWDSIPTSDPSVREGICSNCAEKRRSAAAS